MAKGNKRNRWLKTGIKEAKRVMKAKWNRQVRHSNVSYDNCEYKRIAKSSIYKLVP